MRPRSVTDPAAPPGRSRLEAPGHPLPRTFYDRSAVALARAVLGRLLVCDSPAGRVGGVIVEAEAYRGASDPASHAFRGITPRNRAMFGPPGHAYVYLIYGLHLCLNLVAEREGRGAAVLVRALAPALGEALMRRRRGSVPAHRLASGPGNLGRALGLTLGHDGADLTVGPVWLSDARPRRFGRVTARGARVGIRQGLERPWRFYLEGHPCLSGPRGAGGTPAVPRGRQIPVDTPPEHSYYPRSVHRAPR